MDSWCAAGPAAAARSFAAGAHAGAGVSGCRPSRGEQTLRLGRGAAPAAQGAVRAVAEARYATQRWRLRVLPQPARERSTVPWNSHLAETFAKGRGTQSDQTLHQGGLPSRARALGTGRSSGEAALRSEGFQKHGFPPARPDGCAEIMTPGRAFAMMVRAYQLSVSPLLPAACRFHPSCSDYAREALLRHGALRGGWLTAHRLCRCGPWSAGGFDPVP